MRRLIATLRHAHAALAGTFVALTVAGAVVTWAISLGNSGNTSQLPTERLARAAVVVLGDPTIAVTTGSGSAASTDQIPLTSYRRVPTSLASTLAAMPGVRAAVADQAIPVALRLPDGQVAAGTSNSPITGYGWQSAILTPLTLRAGHAPVSTRQLVLSSGLAQATGLRPGDRVSLAGQPSGPFTIVGIATAPARDAPASNTSASNTSASGAVFFSPAEAAVLYGHPGQADLIGVVARPGTSTAVLARQVRAAVANEHVEVLTGKNRGAAEDIAAASDLANLAGLSSAAVIIVIVSLFAVASTVALSVAERARTIALQRAVGATPGQIRRMIMAELAVLGAIAGPAAYLPGAWIASFTVRGLAAHQVLPVATKAWASPIEMLPSAAAAIAVAELAGLAAAFRASRIRPTAALAEASTERRAPSPLRLVLGLGSLGGAVALGVLAVRQPDASQQLNEAQYVLLACLAGIAFLGPYLVMLAERLLRLPLHLAGGTAGRLASAQIRARSRRVASAAVAIAMPVGFAGAITIVDATQIHAATTQGPQRLAADAVVTAPGPGLSPSALGPIRAEPGVTSAVGLTPTTIYLPGAGSTAAEALTAGPLGAVLRLGVTSGSLAGFGRGDIALSQLEAGPGGTNAHIGETITAYLADGTPYRAKVVAIYSRSMGFADALVPTAAAGGGHLGASGLGEILVSASPRTAAGVPAKVAALGSRYPGMEVASRSVANAQYDLLDSQASFLNNLLLVLIGLLAAVALVNVLILATIQGNDELDLLRRLGATARQLFRTTAWQAAEIAVTGVVLGAIACAAAVCVIAKALTGSWLPYVSAGPTAVIIGAVVLLTGLATLVPTGTTLSRPRDGR